jgi:para-aminobenzoate synthetase component 1
MVLGHGLPAVFARHQRWAEGVRAGVRAWGLEIQCQDPAVYSPVLTGVMTPQGLDADAVRKLLLEKTPAQPAAKPFRLLAPFVSNYSRDEYLQRFQRIIDYIHAGDCYQVNLAQCFTAPCEGDSFTAFEQLQIRANAPFAAYLQDGEHTVLSFSPERFVKVDQGVVTTQPIKGTKPRSSDPVQDLHNRHALENSNKDKAENLMIVDLLRNDLGRVCSFGSVTVEALFELQSFTNVHHLVSTIKGRLQQPDDVFGLLAACFPGGSITGTPKLRSMQIINELETMPRSVYCGVIAWIDHSGNMDSNIAIRTLVRDRNHIHCWGGGGIVADSVGSEEYQETLDKISMLINNL